MMGVEWGKPAIAFGMFQRTRAAASCPCVVGSRRVGNQLDRAVRLRLKLAGIGGSLSRRDSDTSSLPHIGTC